MVRIQRHEAMNSSVITTEKGRGSHNPRFAPHHQNFLRKVRSSSPKTCFMSFISWGTVIIGPGKPLSVCLSVSLSLALVLIPTPPPHPGKGKHSVSIVLTCPHNMWIDVLSAYILIYISATRLYIFFFLFLFFCFPPQSALRFLEILPCPCVNI